MTFKKGFYFIFYNEQDNIHNTKFQYALTYKVEVK